MSPAARRLVGSHFGSTRDKSQLAASYTPKRSTPKVLTPASLRSGSNTPLYSSSSRSIPTPTPSRSSKSPKQSTSAKASSTKTRAADFF
jgi:hypothetical protein